MTKTLYLTLQQASFLKSTFFESFIEPIEEEDTVFKIVINTDLAAMSCDTTMTLNTKDYEWIPLSASVFSSLFYKLDLEHIADVRSTLTVNTKDINDFTFELWFKSQLLARFDSKLKKSPYKDKIDKINNEINLKRIKKGYKLFHDCLKDTTKVVIKLSGRKDSEKYLEHCIVAWEGCHKIYIIDNKNDLKTFMKLTYDFYPLSDLPDIVRNSCSLWFIEHGSLKKSYVLQNDNYLDWVVEICND